MIFIRSFYSLGFGLLVFLPALSYSKDSPLPETYLSDAHTKKIITWDKEVSWIWHKGLEAGLVATPYLRIKLIVPHFFRLESPLKENQTIADPEGSLSQKVGNSLIMDIPFFLNRVVVPLKGAKSFDLEVKINYLGLKHNIDNFLFHQSCEEKGLSLRPLLGASPQWDRLPIVALSCRENKDNFEVQLIYTYQLNIEKIHGEFQLSKGDFRTLLHFPIRKLLSRNEDIVGRISIYPQGSTATTNFELQLRQSFLPSSFSVELMGDLFRYHEQPLNLNIDQWSLATKANYNAPLFKDSFYGRLSLFTTLLPIIQSPASIDKFYIFGGEALLGYKYFGNSSNKNFIYLGFNNSNMSVPAGNFGFQNLYGIKTKLISTIELNNRTLRFSADYVTLFSPQLFFAKNQIFSAEIAYELPWGSSTSKRYLLMTWSHGQYSSQKQEKRAEFGNLSLGISIAI